MNKKILFRWIKVIVLLYSIIGIAFYYLQDYVLYQPEKVAPDSVYQFKQPHTDFSIPVNETSSINIIQFTSTNTVTKGVVLYFHGNKKNVSWYARFAPYFTDKGYEVWMMDYPGYGKSTGIFSEAQLYAWAKEVYKLARPRYSPDSIIIYGKSMGTGIAAYLASIRNCKHLILETPYWDFPSVVRPYLPVYPLERMMKLKIPTHDYLEKVEDPVTIFHGTDDGIVRYGNSERLQPLLKKGSELVTIEGGSHNDLFQFPIVIQKLDSILKK